MIRKGMFIGDRYEIVDKVGSGGMSDVYKALDHKLNRYVAIKVLKNEFSEDKNFVSKFKVEAQSAAGLTHPNIVNVYDVGEDNNIHYIVMELIDGITLKKYIEKKGPLPVKEAVSIAIQVSQGIEAAHNNNIIHRDIKPQNIMISREGKVKVTDFGIARATSSNTINSNAMGSVHYISPEQARGGYIDEKSDIYSLGITLYELITGKVPFEGDSTVNVALQHINDEIVSPKDIIPTLPVSVEKIILKCTQKKSDLRYAKVTGLIADLKQSLITPDEDFVQMATVNVSVANTRPITEQEVQEIRNGKAGIQLEEEEAIDAFESDDEDDIFGEDDDIDAVDSKSDKMLFIGAIVAGIAFIIFTIVLLMKAYTGCGGDVNKEDEQESTTIEETINSTQTRVPNIIGETMEEAAKILDDASLGYKVEYKFSNEFAKGLVMEMSKEADEIVDKHTTITIVISKGKTINKMPDVVGMEIEEAEKMLKDEETYGLKVTVNTVTSDEEEFGIVISTDPAEGEEVAYGAKVTITYSIGEDDTDPVVPDILNMNKDRAKDELQKLGLGMKVEKEDYHDTIAVGNIIAQDLPEGTEVPKGTIVGVSVSKGPEPTTEPEPTTKKKVEVPDVTGMSQSKAQSTLEKAGLKMNVSEERYDENEPEGNVIEQSASGTKVEEGSTIDVVVSKGKEPSKEVTATFPSVSTSDFDVTDGTTGTIVKMELTYTNSSNQSVSEVLDLAQYGVTTAFDTAWTQSAFGISKSDAKSGTEATVTFTLSYTMTNEDGTQEEVTTTATTTAVFN